MNGWLIALIVVVSIAVFLIFLVLFIKKLIKNKIIDAGAEVITKTTNELFDEKTAGKVNKVTDISAKIAKGGKMAIIKMAAKKSLEMAKDKKKANQE